MNVSEQLLIGAGTIIVSLAGSWAVIKYRLDRDEREREKKDLQNEKDHDVLFSLVREVKQLNIDHDKESSQVRVAYEKRFGENDANIRVIQSQYSEILKRLDGNDRKIDRLLEKLDDEA